MAAHNFTDRLQGSFTFYHMSEVSWEGGANDVPAYDRLDLRLAQSFDAGPTDGLVELIVQNAFGEEYIEYEYNNNFDTRYFVRLTLSF